MKQINRIMKGMVLTILMVGFSTLRSMAQDTGEISGEIVDSVETIIGGVIMIEGNSKFGAYSDENGKYVIKNVKPGIYKVTISYFGYSPITIEDVKVEAGKTTDLGKTTLLSDIEESKVVEVVGKKTTNTIESAIKEKKESKQVVEVISAEQISKSQDRDAAQVMQRVPGVTIIDNRFVMIRGLSERYNVVMINDAIAPNTEVDRRSFSFDLIPSQMIERVSIYKSGAADIPGDFAAGVIKLYTKNVPDKNYFLVSLTGGYRGGTTFKDYNTNYTGKSEFLGFGDPSRNLPGNFPSTAYLNSNSITDAQKQQAALLLPNRFGYSTTKATPDLRLNIEIGRKFSLGKIDLGNITSVNYSNVYQAQTIKRFDYGAYDSITGKSDPRTAFSDNRTAKTVRLGIIHNWNVSLNARNKIDFKNFFNQQSENETVIRDGMDYGSFGTTDSLRSYSYRYTTRTLFTSQLGGRHRFNSNKTSFNWTLGYSNISRNIPDWIRFRTHKKIGTSGPYIDIVPSSATVFENARFNSNLTESVMMASGALEHKFVEDADSIGVSLKVGYYLEARSREFKARWMSLKTLQSNAATDSILALPIDQIFSPSVIGSANGFKIEDGTSPSDRYIASSQLYAGFAALTIPLKKWNIQTGVRVEAYHQVLKTATFVEKINLDTFIVSPLPFLNTSYNFTKKMLARLAYSKTVNRAEFRELAPFSFYDFDLNTNYVGNPNLKMCNIHNADIRWEYYPSASEIISLGVFYKRFNNPIEVWSRGSSPRRFEFQNSDYANNAGVELEVRKSFDDISNIKFIKNLSFLFNGSIIHSRVHSRDSIIDPVTGQLQASGQLANRPLQGQSPYVINTGLYYTADKKGVSVSVLYNVFGKRIFIVGDKNGNATIYEMPRHSIDLTIQKKLSKHWEGRFGIQDLLNFKTRFFQDSNQDNKITSADEPFVLTKRGTYFTLGIQYKF